MAEVSELPDAGAAGNRGASRINWEIDLAIGLVLAAVTLTVWLPLVRWNVFTGDEGYLSYGVQRVIEGQLPYRDFQRNHAPGVYYMLVPIFRTFGASLIVTRVFCLVLLAVAGVATYLVARAVTPRWAACLAALQCVLMPPPMHKTYVPLMVLAGLALCAGLSRGTWGRWKTALAGMGIGAIALLRQDVACYTFLIASMSVALVQIVGREKAAATPLGRRLVKAGILCAALAAGVGVIWAPVLAFFAAKGALADIIRQVLLGGLRDHMEMTLPFPPISKVYARGIPLGGRLDASLFYFPAAMIAVGVIIVLLAVVRKKARHKHFLIAQWTAMALLMHTLIMLRTDSYHVKQVLAAPSFIFACLAGAAAAGLWSVRRSPLGMLRRAPAFLLSALIVLWGAGITARAVRSDILVTRASLKKALMLDEPRARLLLDRAQKQNFEELFRTIRQMTGPDEPIFVAPYNSVLYFVAQRRNPTRYDALFPAMVSSTDAQRDVIREVEEGRVRLIIVEDVAWDGLQERRFLNYAPVIRQYLSDDFVREKNIGRFIVFVRKTPGADGTPTQSGEPHTAQPNHQGQAPQTSQ